ncbi:MAG: mechanosensitive ion channel domain-containing protein [Bacteroidota bacterium]
MIFLQTGSGSFDILREMLEKLASALPKVILAIIVFIVGYIVAKIVARIVTKLLSKVGVDKLGEKLNQIDLISQSSFEIVPSKVLGKIIYYLLLLISTLVATDILGIPAVSQLFKDIISFIPNLLVALIVLLLGILLADVIKNLVYTTCTSLGIPSAKLISSFLFYFLFINVVIMALTQANIETEFIASNISILIGGAVAAFAIGYGLASKDVVANFIASFYTKDRFTVGDQVVIDDEDGTITEVDRSSITIDNGEYRTIIPLSKAISGKIKIKKP